MSDRGVRSACIRDGVAAGAEEVSYQKDVKFAVDAIGKQCKGHEQHLLLLWRLLARLHDGHAAVKHDVFYGTTESFGVAPQEVMPFAVKDLVIERDTLITRAEQLLREFPLKFVRYDPAKYGLQSTK
ncbi:MAG: hypothetical protein ACI91B_002476 [Planctomycetota bacterium]|jgi:hypothetical protein